MALFLNWQRLPWQWWVAVVAVLTHNGVGISPSVPACMGRGGAKHHHQLQASAW